jgi:carbon monoxide dehydrogenase subunit G
MELIDTFDVPAPIDEAWRVLTDVELIAPCMPGARLTEVEGETFRGTVKIKVGPITAQFKGDASFVERDEDAHRAVLKAEGRDTGGKGNANATITAELEPAGNGTRVTITTDLAISGKVAQFGKATLGEVSTKLLGQFTDCLEHRVLGEDRAAQDPEAETDTPAPASASPTASAAPDNSADTSGPGDAGDPSEPAARRHTTSPNSPGATGAPAGPRRIDAPDADPIDLLEAAGAGAAARYAPLAGAAAVAFVLGWLFGRRR